MTATNPFRPSKSPPARTLFERLSKSPRPDLAEAALRELLSRTTPDRVRPQDVRTIFDEHHVDTSQVHELRHKMWKTAFRAFASDGVIAAEEHAYLESLRTLLNIGSHYAMQAEEEILMPRYREAIK